MFKFFYMESYVRPFNGAHVLSQWNTETKELLCWWKIKELKRETKEQVINRFKKACERLSWSDRQYAASFQYNTDMYQIHDGNCVILIDKQSLKMTAWTNKLPIIHYDISLAEFEELQVLYLGELYDNFLESIKRLKEKTQGIKSKNKFIAWVKRLGC